MQGEVYITSCHGQDVVCLFSATDCVYVPHVNGLLFLDNSVLCACSEQWHNPQPIWLHGVLSVLLTMHQQCVCHGSSAFMHMHNNSLLIFRGPGRYMRPLPIGAVRAGYMRNLHLRHVHHLRWQQRQSHLLVP